jgi:peptide/nickel transport system ATP-binding protein
VGLSERAMCALRGDRIGMIFQEPMTALNPVHTIGRQVAEPLRLHRGLSAPRRRARKPSRCWTASASPMRPRRIDAYPHQFSGGQRQRVTIAMALACGPDLLIADEPTTALDVTIQQQILDLIRELVAERGMALILISHDLGVIAQNVRRDAGDVRRQRGRERPTRPCSPTARTPTRWACSPRGPRLGAPRGGGWPPSRARCPNWSTCRRAARSRAAAASRFPPAT